MLQCTVVEKETPGEAAAVQHHNVGKMSILNLFKHELETDFSIHKEVSGGKRNYYVIHVLHKGSERTAGHTPLLNMSSSFLLVGKLQVRNFLLMCS